MKKYHEAISDCDSALLIDPKCKKSITQKGNALLGLKRFDEAKECYESLRSLGENESADNLLKKLHDVQETDFRKVFFNFIVDVTKSPKVSKAKLHHASTKNKKVKAKAKIKLLKRSAA